MRVVFSWSNKLPQTGFPAKINHLVDLDIKHRVYSGCKSVT